MSDLIDTATTDTPIAEMGDNRPPAVLGFDYTKLAPAYAERVYAAAQVIRQHIRKSVEEAWSIGKALREIKDILDHGQFGNWIEQEFRFSNATASRYMRLYDGLPNFCTMQSLRRSASSTLYKLTDRQTQPHVRDGIVRELEAGTLRGTPKLIEAEIERRRNEAKGKGTMQAKPTPDELEVRKLRQRSIDAVLFLKSALSDLDYDRYAKLLKGCAMAEYFQLALAENPYVVVGLATGDLIGRDGLPVTDNTLVDYQNYRDTQPVNKVEPTPEAEPKSETMPPIEQDLPAAA